MIRATINGIRNCSCGRHKDDLFLAVNQDRRCDNRSNDMAFSHPTFTYIKQTLFPHRRVMRITSTAKDVTHNLFHNKALVFV